MEITLATSPVAPCSPQGSPYPARVVKPLGAQGLLPDTPSTSIHPRPTPTPPAPPAGSPQGPILLPPSVEVGTAGEAHVPLSQFPGKPVSTSVGGEPVVVPFALVAYEVILLSSRLEKKNTASDVCFSCFAGLWGGVAATGPQRRAESAPVPRGAAVPTREMLLRARSWGPQAGSRELGSRACAHTGGSRSRAGLPGHRPGGCGLSGTRQGLRTP